MVSAGAPRTAKWPAQVPLLEGLALVPPAIHHVPHAPLQHHASTCPAAHSPPACLVG